MNRNAFPALAGVIAVASGAAVAELVAALLGRPQAGTVVVVGSVLVDAAPTPVKEFAVATLGTADKPVLLGGIGVVLAVLAAGLGIVACRNRAVGPAGAAVLGLVGTAAALTRPAAHFVDALPSMVGMLVIAGALLLLLRALRPVVTERTRAFGRPDLPNAAFAHRDAGRRGRGRGPARLPRCRRARRRRCRGGRRWRCPTGPVVGRRPGP